MMNQAKQALVEAGKNPDLHRPKIIAVTVLTSLDDGELKKVGFDIPVIELTKKLALLAKEAGLDGVVAGGSEIEMIRETCGRDFLIITPGVRIEDKKDDQKRTITPKEAIQKGASYIVLGRAVRDAADPGALLKKIAEDIRDALSL